MDLKLTFFVAVFFNIRVLRAVKFWKTGYGCAHSVITEQLSKQIEPRPLRDVFGVYEERIVVSEMSGHGRVWWCGPPGCCCWWGRLRRGWRAPPPPPATAPAPFCGGPAAASAPAPRGPITRTTRTASGSSRVSTPLHPKCFFYILITSPLKILSKVNSKVETTKN